MEDILKRIVKQGIVVISGKFGSGKDSLALIVGGLLEEMGHKVVYKSAAAEVNKIYEQITGINYCNLPREKKEPYREQFRDFANATKKIIGADVWAKKVVEDDDGESIVIVTDFRFLHDEWLTYLNHEPVCLRIERPIQMRFPEHFESYQRYLENAKNFAHHEPENFMGFLRGVYPSLYYKISHYSENELDTFPHFDLTINNDYKTLDELVKFVKEVL